MIHWLGVEDTESIAEMLDHVTWSECSYFNRLDLGFALAEMSGDSLTKPEKVRAQTRTLSPNLMRDDRVVEKVGGKWSARKVLRCTIWRKRNHTQRIEMILNLAKA